MSLVMGAMFTFASAAIFGYVGLRLARRDISSEVAKRAWKMFLVWWFCVALGAFVNGVMNLLAASGITSLQFYVAATYMNLLLVCAALWGLVYYLLYLFTGSTRTLAVLTLFYVLCFVLLVYYINARDPISVNIETWDTSLVYRVPFSRPAVALFILLMLYLPQILSSAAYFGLYFRLKDATQRYRVLLVSWSIMLWFLTTLSATLTGFTANDWWQIVSRLIGIAAAAAIFLAYFPSGYLQRRFGVKAIGAGD